MAYTYISDSVIELCELSEVVTTPDFCENEIVLSRLITPHYGKMDFTMFPYMRQILEHWDYKHVEKHTLMASIQTAKTTIMFCCIAKSLVDDPCPMQLTIPSDKNVSSFLSAKLDPFLKGVKKLQNLLRLYSTDNKFRTKGALKQVPEGMLYIVGNTATNRASNTVKYVFIEEASLIEQAHIIELIGRSNFFEKTGRKAYLSSSRRFAGDAIETNYNDALCKFDLVIKCEKCSNEFYPTSKNFYFQDVKTYCVKHKIRSVSTAQEANIYKAEAMKSACIQCSCGESIDSSKLERMILDGRVFIKKVEGEMSDITYGYRLNALATGLTKYSTIARLIIEADGDEVALANIWTDYFNEIYESKTTNNNESDILLLSNNLPLFVVPNDTVSVFLGVDTQKDHFWAELVAYVVVEKDGRKGLVRHTIFAKRQESFNDLVQLKESTIYYNDGDVFERGVACMGIDMQGYYEEGETVDEETGIAKKEIIVNRPQEVREFVYEMSEIWGKNGEMEHIYATVGKERISNDEPYRFTKTNMRIEGYNEVRELRLLNINTTAKKLSLFSSIARTIDRVKREAQGEDHHYDFNLKYISEDIINPLVNAEVVSYTAYHHQLTSEVWGYGTDSQGRKKKKKSFNQIKKDNHFIDTSVIADTLADLFGIVKKDPAQRVEGADAQRDLQSAIDAFFV